MRVVKVENRVEEGEEGEGSSDIQCLRAIYFFMVSLDYHSFFQGTFLCIKGTKGV